VEFRQVPFVHGQSFAGLHGKTPDMKKREVALELRGLNIQEPEKSRRVANQLCALAALLSLLSLAFPPQ
jgi:hypothetical protein